MKSKKHLIKVGLLFAIITIAFLGYRFALGQRINLPLGLWESFRDFVSRNPDFSMEPYKDGTIILVKPIATGVGEGRYEAGDIVEIRDGSKPLGREERRMLLPLYYDGKITEEQKQMLVEPEFENSEIENSLKIENSEIENSPQSHQTMTKRRQYGIDYTQVLSDREIIKVRSFKQLDRIPEIDLSAVIDKKSGLSFNDSNFISSDNGQLAGHSFFFDKQKKSQDYFNNLQTIHLFNDNNNDSGASGNIKTENVAESSIKSEQDSLVFNSEVKNIFIAAAGQSGILDGNNVKAPFFYGGNKVFMDAFVSENFEHVKKNELSDAESGTEFKNFFFGKGSGRIAQSHSDIFNGDAWVLFGNFFNGIAGLQKIQDIGDGDSRSFNAGLAESNHLLDGNTSSLISFSNNLSHINDYRVNKSNVNSVVQLPPHLERIEKTRNFLKALARSIIPFVFAQTEYKKTIMQSGGDYASLNAWEGAEQQDLVTNNRYAVAEIDGAWTSADTTAVTINGWTTDATHYIKIYTTTAARHDGKWNTGKYRLSVGHAMPLTISEGYVRVEGLQMSHTLTYASSNYIIQLPSEAGETQISNCILRELSAAYSGGGISGPYIAGTVNRTTKIWNNIIYDFTNTTNGYGIRINDTDWLAYIYNNTFHSCNLGIRSDYDNTIIAKNNLFKSCTTVAYGTFAAGTDYNATNNASMGYTVTGGGNTHDRLSQTFTFADEAGDDFHLALADLGARGYGLSQYADANCPVTTDIDANYRRPNGEPTDIGADEDIDTLDSESVRISNIQQSGTRYTTLSAWEADRDGVITGYYPEVAQIDGAWTSADTTAVTIDGWTTDATHYIKIYTTTAARHDGKWNTGKYRLEVSDGAVLIPAESNTRIEGLQINQTRSDLNSHGIYSESIISDIKISNNIVKLSGTGVPVAAGISIIGGIGTDIKIWNNIVYDWVDGISIEMSQDSSNVIYNNTVYNCGSGYSSGWEDALIKNSIAQNCTNGFKDSGWRTGSDYNLSDLAADAPGANSRNEINVTFVNEAGDDFHLASNDAGALGYGKNLFTDLYLSFTDDIDGQNRVVGGANWDIGADEFYMPKARIRGDVRFKGDVKFK